MRIGNLKSLTVVLTRMMVAGIVILSPIAMASNIRFNVDKFSIEGLNPLSASATERVLAPYLGEHDGVERLRESAASLEKAINGNGRGFYRVVLPAQVLESGVITLEIGQLVIDRISVSGNKHFSDQNIIRSLPQLKQGQTPNTNALSRALAVANFNTAKKTRLTFGKGSGPDSLDAQIEVRDKPPHQYYAWLNNTGSENTTRTRLGIGYQHRNLFDRDHNVTATYTTSPEDADKVSQYGINYQIPAYLLTGTVNIFHVSSDIDSGRVAEVFDVSGGGSTTGIRYSQVLNKLGEYRQRIYVDVVDKLFDNDIDFVGNNVGVDVRSRPLTATYQIEWAKQHTSGRLNTSFVTNLSGGSFNTSADYENVRAGAPQDFQVFKIDATQDVNLPKLWRVGLGIQAQYTSDPLISGEQLGLGGSIGPRGFEERETGVDRGANLRLQLWGPPVTNNLELGAFIDHGFGTILNPQDGEIDSREITSVGVASKWQWQDRLVSTVSVGHVLEGFDEEPELSQDGDNRVHFSFVYRLNSK